MLEVEIIRKADKIISERNYRIGMDNTSQIKIGKFVRSTLRDLLNQELLSEKEAKLLTTYEYTKRKLNINYPLLIEIDFSKSLKQQRLVNGMPRYWNEVFVIGNEKYLVCQEWYERNRSYFEAWIRGLELE